MVAQNTSSTSHWVFGYGSLIWHPGFAFARSTIAILRGAHRSLSVYSHHYRGTVEQPGLVFGLVRGGSCRGMAFEVSPSDWDEAHHYLSARELVTDVYKEVFRPIRLVSGEVVQAMTYMVDEAHVQYAGRLSMEAQLDMVRLAVGQSGLNTEYVLNTAEHLRRMGIVDRQLELLASRLDAPEVAAQ